jgi:hypothetical protein
MGISRMLGGGEGGLARNFSFSLLFLIVVIGIGIELGLHRPDIWRFREFGTWQEAESIDRQGLYLHSRGVSFPLLFFCSFCVVSGFVPWSYAESMNLRTLQ